MEPFERKVEHTKCHVFGSLFGVILCLGESEEATGAVTCMFIILREEKKTWKSHYSKEVIFALQTCV